VVEMEHRRRSGRAVRDWFVVEHGGAAGRGRGGGGAGVKAAVVGGARGVVRLEEHPEYPRPEAEGGDAPQEAPETTFNLGLSDKERRDREGVRLPYLDAQNEGGIGEGGRILYDMGIEDDFDDEEDEI
jgi:elongator complex protein 5